MFKKIVKHTLLEIITVILLVFDDRKRVYLVKGDNMFKKIVKYTFLAIVTVILLGVLVAIPFLIKARNEGDRLYNKYESYTDQVLEERFDLKEFPIKPEYRKLHPAKFLKMMKYLVTSRQSDRMARINSLDATMFYFMKMYTLMIRPEYAYNLPVLSIDFIFIGGLRVYVIEIIDPAKIDDPNKEQYYAKMKKWMPQVLKFKQSKVSDWFFDYITDFSIHISADRADDEVLFEIYKTYLNAYLDMAESAEKVSPDKSQKLEAGLDDFVTTLLDKGGPAVNVFEKFMGSEKQREYIRTVMFGLEE